MDASAVFAGPEVSLPEMLDARERRALAQARLMAAAPELARAAGLDGRELALVSITLVVAGPVKTSPALVEVFEALVAEARAAIGEAPVLDEVELGGATGPELVMLVASPAGALKRALCAIEQGHPWGRLADFDVLAVPEAPVRGPQDLPASLSRTELGLPPRACLVCGGPAKACARSRAHTVDELQHAIATIIKEGGQRSSGKED